MPLAVARPRQSAAKKQNQDPSTRVSRAGEYAREPSLAQDDSFIFLCRKWRLLYDLGMPSGFRRSERVRPICYKHQLAWPSSSVHGLWIVLPDTTCTPSSLTWAPALP